MEAAAAIAIRPARRADAGVLHDMIRGLAEYEKLAHLHVGSVDELAASLFGPQPAAEALVAWAGDAPAGFALYFHNFSTFLGKRGLWLEDLYVLPAFRRRGCGVALLRELAGIARARDCGRFEWAVLDWNTSAIAFYESLGAAILPDWRIARVTGAALADLAHAPPTTG